MTQIATKIAHGVSPNNSHSSKCLINIDGTDNGLKFEHLDILLRVRVMNGMFLIVYLRPGFPVISAVPKKVTLYSLSVIM